MTVCGTGGWSGPLPGDPNTNIVLMATPAFGGVDVSWTFPTTNPGAVAHIELYRGLNATFGNAIPLTVTGGNFYYDKNTFAVDTQFFYWARVVSINETIGEWVGPAVAIAKPTVADMLTLLSGQIDSSLLAQDLRTELDNIPTLTTGLANEALARLNDNVALGNALNAVQSGTNQALTLIETEAIERIGNHEALASVVDTLAAGVGTNAAAIVTEQLVRASAYDALASQIDTLIASNNTAGNHTYLQSSAPTVGMEDGDVWYDSDDNKRMYRYNGTAWVDVSDDRIGSNVAAIVAEQTARVDADTAITTSLTTALSTISSNTAAISTEAQTRVDADTALASSITAAQTTLNGNIAAAQTTLQTNIDAVDGEVTNIGARYTAKLSVNGLVGGFGIYNTGAEIDAGFDVDTFWIGKDVPNKRKPFMVVGDETFIDQAVINELTFTKLRDSTGGAVISGGKIQSNYLSTKGLDVTDSLGNVILSAGSSVQSQIAPYSSGATVGATIGTNLSGQITSGNASTYIANAAIQDAQIGTLNASKIDAGFINAGRISVGTATQVATSTHTSVLIYSGTPVSSTSEVIVDGSVVATTGGNIWISLTGWVYVNPSDASLSYLQVYFQFLLSNGTTDYANMNLSSAAVHSNYEGGVCYIPINATFLYPLQAAHATYRPRLKVSVYNSRVYPINGAPRAIISSTYFHGRMSLIEMKI